MKFWQNLAFMEPAELTELAQFAEEVGFDGITLGDHLFLTEATNSPHPYSPPGKPIYRLDYPYPEVWSAFGAMAAVTTRLHLCPSVYILPLRSPLELAKATSTLAQISDNRVALGFGVGWLKEEFDAVGVEFSTRGRRTDEMLDVLRKLWGGGVVSHEGRFFNFTDVIVGLTPTQPLPLYCGGSQPAALRRAANLCDGWVGHGHTVEELSVVLAELKRLRVEAGRDDRSFEIIVPLKLPGPLPDLDTLGRLEALGVTTVMAAPLAPPSSPDNVNGFYGGTMTGKLDDRKRAMEQYAREVIGRMP
jgi:probable F420-dependent oxidoreductase